METIIFACENGSGMSRGSFCTNSQLRALKKARIWMNFYILLYVLHFSICFHRNLLTLLTLRLWGCYPACIFHHIWYCKTRVSIIFDHIHCILHHMYDISYHIYGTPPHVQYCFPLGPWPLVPIYPHVACWPPSVFGTVPLSFLFTFCFLIMFFQLILIKSTWL